MRRENSPPPHLPHPILSPRSPTPLPSNREPISIPPPSHPTSKLTTPPPPQLTLMTRPDSPAATISQPVFQSCRPRSAHTAPGPFPTPPHQSLRNGRKRPNPSTTQSLTVSRSLKKLRSRSQKIGPILLLQTQKSLRPLQHCHPRI